MKGGGGGDGVKGGGGGGDGDVSKSLRVTGSARATERGESLGLISI